MRTTAQAFVVAIGCTLVAAAHALEYAPKLSLRTGGGILRNDGADPKDRKSVV